MHREYVGGGYLKALFGKEWKTSEYTSREFSPGVPARNILRYSEIFEKYYMKSASLTGVPISEQMYFYDKDIERKRELENELKEMQQFGNKQSRNKVKKDLKKLNNKRNENKGLDVPTAVAFCRQKKGFIAYLGDCTKGFSTVRTIGSLCRYAIAHRATRKQMKKCLSHILKPEIYGIIETYVSVDKWDVAKFNLQEEETDGG
eukprot:CAMPEP_0167742744 /NCGR_PEP_ID=MMETSP0110_2-20121227/1611_1 /TAXON_ID=629695 /ORGANISM="Gymnochlora sp., Strain CCMP2014" /LENGTH=202 /DNA_ID=CAMNT_0007626999 /DNA_START=30 /DNA_END=635 /DNA_ORIENTATION=-